MDLQKTFSLLGLKEDHLAVYLANLEWGETIITNIARKSKVPRTTIYLLIKDLLDLGLVTRFMRDGQTLYVASDPEFIKTLLKQRQDELQYSISLLDTNMSQLKAMQNSNPKKPKVEFLEGSEGIKQAYNRTFEAKEIWIQCLTEDYTEVVSDEFFNNYFEKFFNTNIKSKELLKFGDDEYISKYGSKKNLQLIAPMTADKVETDFWVYDNKVTFVSFNKENPYALVVEDKDIANAMKTMYDLAWKKASVEDPRVKKGEEVRVEFE
jgi:sugar-specific transcriptional regulator TrmB